MNKAMAMIVALAFLAIVFQPSVSPSSIATSGTTQENTTTQDPEDIEQLLPFLGLLECCGLPHHSLAAPIALVGSNGPLHGPYTYGLSLIPANLSGLYLLLIPSELSGLYLLLIPSELSGLDLSLIPSELSGFDLSLIPSELSGFDLSLIPSELSGFVGIEVSRPRVMTAAADFKPAAIVETAFFWGAELGERSFSNRHLTLDNVLRIFELREDLGLSRGKIAEKVGVSRTSVNKVLGYRHPISKQLATPTDLLKACYVDIEAVWGKRDKLKRAGIFIAPWLDGIEWRAEDPESLSHLDRYRLLLFETGISSVSGDGVRSEHVAEVYSLLKEIGAAE